jgi:hypothetical protein
MKQQKTAVDQIERFTRQPRRAGVSRLKRYICKTSTLANIPGLFELRHVGIDSSHASRGANHLGEHTGHGADAAAEIGNAHTGCQAGLQEDSPSGR